MLRFALKTTQELYDPLVAALGTGGAGMMGTVLLCETLLSFLPNMSTKDRPYHLLRHYNITPITSGVMATERRLTLHNFATAVGGVLHISNPVIHRVFVPLTHLPAQGRRQVYRMLELLEEIRGGDGESVAKKCATILVKLFADELLSSGIVPRRAVLLSAQQLVGSGCSLFSVVPAVEFASRAFDIVNLPQTSRLRDFLEVSHDLCGELLLPALADELLSKYSFVPRVTLSQHTLSVSATSFCALSKCSVTELRAKARAGSLIEDDCTPLLRAVEVTLLLCFSLDSRLTKKVVK